MMMISLLSSLVVKSVFFLDLKPGLLQIQLCLRECFDANSFSSCVIVERGTFAYEKWLVRVTG